MDRSSHPSLPPFPSPSCWNSPSPPSRRGLTPWGKSPCIWKTSPLILPSPPSLPPSLSLPQLLEFAVSSVTAGIDALGEVTVRLEDLSTGKIYYGRSANTDVVVAATQAYLSALNRVAVSRGAMPLHPQFGKI